MRKSIGSIFNSGMMSHGGPTKERKSSCTGKISAGAGGGAPDLSTAPDIQNGAVNRAAPQRVNNSLSDSSVDKHGTAAHTDSRPDGEGAPPKGGSNEKIRPDGPKDEEAGSNASFPPKPAPPPPPSFSFGNIAYQKSNQSNDDGPLVASAPVTMTGLGSGAPQQPQQDLQRQPPLQRDPAAAINNNSSSCSSSAIPPDQKIKSLSNPPHSSPLSTG